MRTNILEYLEETSSRLPNKTAFSDGNYSLTFKELRSAAEAVGSRLIERGLGREPVLLIMDKHPNTVAAFLGVIYAGGFYVPLDPDTPPRRAEAVAASVEARFIICDEKNRAAAEALLPGGALSYDELVSGKPDVRLEQPDAVRLSETRSEQPDAVRLSETRSEQPDAGHLAESRSEQIDTGRLAEVRAGQIDTDLIYVVFTSGSTGVPKGVAACHRSVIDYAEALCEALPFDGDTVFGNQTPLYFDAPLKEILPTLKLGATTYLIPKKLFPFPIRLLEYLKNHKINTICWVVSALSVISSLGALEKERPEQLRLVAFGSEVFPLKQFKIWRDALPGTVFFNLYGPTEATGMSTYYRVEREFSEGESIPIGRPFRNTRIMLIGEDGREAPPGGTGEIYIGGTCVSAGYYNNPERTAEAFVQNPLNPVCRDIVYRTGDIARRDGRGELIFISRKDFQIKHMGRRIELGEVEAAADRHPGVARACCVYDGESKKILMFYIGGAVEGELSAFLRDYLPRYMMPAIVTKLDTLPLTPNGKLDRRTLSRMAGLD